MFLRPCDGIVRCGIHRVDLYGTGTKFLEKEMPRQHSLVLLAPPVTVAFKGVGITKRLYPPVKVLHGSERPECPGKG